MKPKTKVTTYNVRDLLLYAQNINEKIAKLDKKLYCLRELSISMENPMFSNKNIYKDYDKLSELVAQIIDTETEVSLLRKRKKTVDSSLFSLFEFILDGSSSFLLTDDYKTLVLIYNTMLQKYIYARRWNEIAYNLNSEQNYLKELHRICVIYLDAIICL